MINSTIPPEPRNGRSQKLVPKATDQVPCQAEDPHPWWRQVQEAITGPIIVPPTGDTLALIPRGVSKSPDLPPPPVGDQGRGTYR